MPDDPQPLEDPKLQRVAENLRGLHDAAGVPPPESTRLTGASVYVGTEGSRPPIQTLIQNIAELLRNRGLYRRGRDIGTVNEGTGEFEVISPHTFCSWVPMTAGITPHKGYKTDQASGKDVMLIADLSVEQARLILQSHELRAKVPEIVHVNLVPLPVYRDELDERDDPRRKGFRKIEWLEPGYDAPTKSFTVHGGPMIDHKWDGLAAAEWLLSLYRTFPWSDQEESGISNRMAVHIACSVTAVARHLFLGKAPFFFYHSNLEGSGKGALVRAALLPVFRKAGPDDIDLADTKELRNVLNTKAGCGASFVWAEELPENWTLNDRQLARWATTETWPFRPMGQNKEMCNADITKMLTVIASNRMTVDRNLQRRVLHADLFPHQEAKERKLPEGTQMLDSAFFADEKNLDKLLSAACSLIRHWDDVGRPQSKDRELESFEDWSRVVPGIVENMGLGRPLVEFVAAGSGDDDSRVMKRLVTKVIDAHCFTGVGPTRKTLDAVTVTMRDIVRTARLNDLFVDRLGALDQVSDDLQGKKGHKWREVEDVGEETLLPDPNEPKGKAMREPNDDEKRLQAAEWLDQATGSSWGKFFRRMAVDERWFLSSCGVAFKFGERGASKTSRFVLRKMT